MNRTVSVDNLLNAFPAPLKVDAKQNALSESTAEELIKLWKDNDLLALYTRIFELDEPLLDILAHDFKVDWYLYDGTLESKRYQIYSLFFVHKHLGTRRAIETALRDICPETIVEEWFEYNGKPYYFRVILDVTEQRTVIYLNTIEHMIDIFKSVRSRLEGGIIALRTRCTILVGCTGNYAYITDRICGTYPRRAMQGRIANNVILVSEKGGSAGFNSPPAGSIITGTYPRAAQQGRILKESIDVSSLANDSAMSVPKTGTVPYAAVKGTMGEMSIETSAQTDSASVIAHKAGSPPDVGAISGDIGDDNISFDSNGGSASYIARPCGKPFGLF